MFILKIIFIIIDELMRMVYNENMLGVFLPTMIMMTNIPSCQNNSSSETHSNQKNKGERYENQA